MGHYASYFTSKDTVTVDITNKQNKNKGFSFTQYEYNLALTNHSLNPSWVLLDTQSSCDIFNNGNLLEDIKVEEGQGLRLHSNGDGLIETNKKGTVKGYGKVWYHPKSLANIMSFSNVRKKFKINISRGPEDEESIITVTR